MFSPGSHLSLNKSSVMHLFVDSFFEGKKALVKERLMDSVRVIVDGLFEEMVGQVKEMIMLPPKESAGTTSAEPSTPKSPVSTSTVPPSQEHQQHQDGRCRSASPPATVPRLMEEPVVDSVVMAEPFFDDEPPAADGGVDMAEPIVDDEPAAAVGGGDEPTVVEDLPAAAPGLVPPRPEQYGVCPVCGVRFRDSDSQRVHWWRVHAGGVRPLICSYPGQKLASRDEWCGHLEPSRSDANKHVLSHPVGKIKGQAMVVDLHLLDTWPMEVARQQKALADPEEGKRAATEQKMRHNALLKRLGIFGKKPHTRNKRS